jgi:uncharacterized membrane protein
VTGKTNRGAQMRVDEAVRYLALGAASGLRSMAAPWRVSRGPARVLFALAAAGEMVGDKLPFAPDRIGPGPLLGRLTLGGGAAAVLASRRGSAPLAGAALGAAGAVLGAHAGFYARRALTRGASLPDVPIALCEDALAFALADAACDGRSAGSLSAVLSPATIRRVRAAASR